MKGKVFLLFFVLLLAFCPFAGGQDKGVATRTVLKLPAKEKRWALIIGVSEYDDGNITPLPGANNDAKALRDALRDYAGFDERQIILLTTDESKDRRPTKNNILRYLGNLSGTVPKDGLLLVAFSGHGIERQKQAFLLASDTPYNDNVRVLERTALSVSNDFKELIRDTGVGQVIILLDACRNDPSSGRSSSVNPLTQAYKDGFSFDLRNREVEAFATLYATSIGDRAYEYARENKGYFTWAVIEALKGGAANEAGEVTLGSLMRYVEKHVPQQVKIDLGSSKVQRPFSIIEGYRAEDLLIGVAKRANNSASLSAAHKTNEEAFWRAIENSSEERDFADYLARIERGEFIGSFRAISELKLARLKKVKSAESWSRLAGITKILLKYDWATDFSDGVAIVCTSGKCGSINKNYKEVTALVYDAIYPFSQGLSRTMIGSRFEGNYGFIDLAGREIVPPKYNFRTTDFKDGHSKVCRHDSSSLGSEVCGFIDRMGKEIIPLKYNQNSMWLSGGLAMVCQHIIVEGGSTQKCGIIDAAGRTVAPFGKYDYGQPFVDGFASVQIGINERAKYGFVDLSGKEVVPLNYTGGVGNFSEGLAVACMSTTSKNRCAFIDKAGKVVASLPPQYDYFDDLSEGLARARIDTDTGNKWGFIDRTGKEIVSAKYDGVGAYSGGFAIVCSGKLCGTIDRTGREVIPLKYAVINPSVLNLFQVCNDNSNVRKCGFIDRLGNVLVPIKYAQRIWSSILLNEGFIGVELNGSKGFVDIYGNEYFDF